MSDYGTLLAEMRAEIDALKAQIREAIGKYERSEANGVVTIARIAAIVAVPEWTLGE